MKKKYKVIFWDFDGVLLNSNKIRDLGFIEVLKDYPENQVDQLMEFHQKNGGLSRYVKFRYFYENILGTSITEEEVNNLAGKFSDIMMKLLNDNTLLIDETLSFVKANHSDYRMHIVSGSDQAELRLLCENLKINHYFASIHGSPTPKNDLVKNLLKENNYDSSNCLLIGDSINDYEAAKLNDIAFLGYGHDNDLIKKTNTSFKF